MKSGLNAHGVQHLFLQDNLLILFSEVDIRLYGLTVLIYILLNKAMIDDWDYQRQLKKGQMDEVDAREHTDAINGMQVNQAALDQEALKGENKNLFF